jgi:hypothetical protein
MKCKSSSSKAKALASCEQKHCKGDVDDDTVQAADSNSSNLVMPPGMDMDALGQLTFMPDSNSGNTQGNTWHIMSSSLSDGLTEKNSGDVVGEMNFIWAEGGGSLRARGCKGYFSGGVIEMVFVSVPAGCCQGPYEMCNHNSANVYTCAGGSNLPGARGCNTCPGGTDFSWPRSGEGSTWSQGAKKQVSAGPLIQSISAAAGCTINSAADCDSGGICFLNAFNGGKAASLMQLFVSHFQSSNSTEVIV